MMKTTPMKKKNNLTTTRKKCTNKSYFFILLCDCQMHAKFVAFIFWGNGIGKLNWYVRCLPFTGTKRT